MVRKAAPDALAIGTRCNLHSTYAVKAAAFDLPLVLEKPVAISTRQAALSGRQGIGGKGPFRNCSTAAQ